MASFRMAFFFFFFFFFFFRLAEMSFVRRVSSFRMALFPFVFWRGVLSSFLFFYLFAWCLFEWRLFAAKRRNGTNQPPYFIHTTRVALPHFGSLLAVTVLNLDFLPLKCQKRQQLNLQTAHNEPSRLNLHCLPSSL